MGVAFSAGGGALDALGSSVVVFFAFRKLSFNGMSVFVAPLACVTELGIVGGCLFAGGRVGCRRGW